MKLLKEDVQMVVKQTNCSVKTAKTILKKYNNDVAEAILSLTESEYKNKNKELLKHKLFYVPKKSTKSNPQMDEFREECKRRDEIMDNLEKSGKLQDKIEELKKSKSTLTNRNKNFKITKNKKKETEQKVINNLRKELEKRKTNTQN